MDGIAVVASLVGLLLFYLVIRLAVRHGIADNRKLIRQAIVAALNGDEDDGPPPPLTRRKK
jgi:hypothetical protein